VRGFLLRLREQGTSTVLRRNIGMTLGRQVFAAVVQLIVVVLIARELGPEGNGFYAMSVLVPTLLTGFLNFGVGPATVYYLSRGGVSAAWAVKGNILIALAVTGLGLITAAPVVYLWGEVIFPGVPISLLFIGFCAFPVTLLLAYLSTVLQGIEDFRAFNLSVLIPPVVLLLGVVSSFYILDLGVSGALASYLLAQTCGLVAILVFLRKFLVNNGSSAAGFSLKAYSRKVIGYGWKAQLSNAITLINYRADVFLVNFLLSPMSAGIYVVAVQISERLWIPSQAASTVLFPRLSAMHEDPDARHALTQKAFVGMVAITALAGGGVAALLYWLLGPLFGTDYIAAFPVLLWLLPGVVLWAGARIQANCIAAAGKPEWNMYVALLVVVVNVAGNILLIPEFGLPGAAAATSGAYVLDAAIKFWLVRLLR